MTGGGFGGCTVNLVDPAAVARFETEIAASYQRRFGVEPRIGRVFTEAEARPGGTPVVILSHGYWQRRFGSDPNIAGKTIRMQRQIGAIVGVMPARFKIGTMNPDIYLPLPLNQDRPWSDRGFGFRGWMEKNESRSQTECLKNAFMWSGQRPLTFNQEMRNSIWLHVF